MSDARDAGQALGQLLADNLAAPATPTIRYGTLARAYLAGSSLVADVEIAGGTLTGIPVTRAAATATIGDRVIITTYAHLSTVTGLMATKTRTLFDWSSTWSGTPAETEYTEKTQSIEIYSGLILCEFRASLKGAGEYGCRFTFTNSSGATAAQWSATSPPMGYDTATLRWTVSGTVYLTPGTYTVTLQTCPWGDIDVESGDKSKISSMWRDEILGTTGVNRMARIIAL